jgi:hypothetical protein
MPTIELPAKNLFGILPRFSFIPKFWIEIPEYGTAKVLILQNVHDGITHGSKNDE